MTKAIFEAFVGSHFDPLFSSAAAFAGAEDAAALNVPALHAAARSAIQKVAANAARALPDPTTRILLIDGDAGFGKTHVLTSTLYKLARDGDVLPAAFQLSADIDENEVTLRLVRATIRELEARHFRDANDRVPLRHLATGLLELAEYNRDAFDEAVADFDEEASAAEAVRAARQIVRALDRRGYSPPDDHLVAAILLTAERVCSPARRWLLGYGAASIGPLMLPPLHSESDYFDILIGISTCAAAIDAPLVLAFDQVEAALTAGTEVLVTRIVTQACQLAELSPTTGIILSALAGTFPGTVLPRLHASIRDRIRNPPCQPVHLKSPDLGVLRTIVDRRCEELVRRAAIEPHPDAGRVMVPMWLVEQHTGQTIRELFREIREYRELCRSLGRFADASEFSGARPAPAPAGDDFDKLWENAKDRALGSVTQLADHERAALFMELALQAPDEMAEVARATVVESDTNRMATRIVDLTFVDDKDQVIEKWRIAFTDEPNSRGRFRDQLDEFLNLTTDAKPAIIRGRPIPGVKDGKPRPEPDLLKLQAGPAVHRLFKAGGRSAYAPDQDWARLQLALDFCRARGDAQGFAEWRRARRFLLDGAAIGEMVQLVQPADGARPTDATRAPASGKPRTDGASSEAVQLFLGYGTDKSKVYWSVDQSSKPVPQNFGLLVSGDANYGRTQLIKALVADHVQLGGSVLLFDFDREYQDSDTDPFATDNGLTTIDLSRGLPINPLRLPPRGASGSQVVEHTFEVGGILQRALSLTESQTSILRSSLQLAYRKLGVPLREWVHPGQTPAPSMADVIAAAREEHDQGATNLLDRLGALTEDGLLPSDADATMSFEGLVGGRLILSFSDLPDDDGVKQAIAELLLIHVQAHLLRGDAHDSLRRLLVIDGARRVADSDRLIAIAREGRAFGAGFIAGVEFPDELAAELTDNLASKLHLFNADARRRKKIVQSTYGTTSSRAARDLLTLLSALRPFDAILRNQQTAPFERLTVEPYARRKGEDV